MAKKNNKVKKNETNIDSIVIELLSDTTFSSGCETLGEVDVEVEYDELGLPILGGKALHGLLRDGWLSIANTFKEDFDNNKVFKKLFGLNKSNDEECILRISDAKFYCDITDNVPNDEDIYNLRKWLEYGINNNNITLEMISNLFTKIRTQTSVDDDGVASEGSLRFTRTISRGIKFKAKLDWLVKPDKDDKKYYLQCLALSTLSVKNVGLARNRGRGHVMITLNGDLELTKKLARGGK